MPKTRRSHSEGSAEIPWRERPFQPLPRAREITGVSIASLYKLADEGRLVFRRIAGRTLVETVSLVQLIDAAEPWTPSDRGAAARASRAETARAAWRS